MTPIDVASGFSRTIVLLALTGAIVAAQQDASDVTLRGVVVTDNDVPLARVRVAVLESFEPPTLTDDRGQFTLRVPDTGSVRLAFTKARYAAVRLEVPRSDGGSLDVVGLRVRLSLGAVISGYVRDRSGEPVLQARVTARRPGAASALIPTVVATTTDDLGEFRFSGLDAGTYVVRVSRVQAGAERNMPAAFEEQTINVSGGAEVVLDLRIDMPSELARYPEGYRKEPGPDATASVRGRVVTPNGTPIAGALVQVRGSEGSTRVETDARGRYVARGLSPDVYMIEAIRRGFSPVNAGRNSSALGLFVGRAAELDRTVLLGAGEELNVDLTLGRGASIAGAVVDEFGEPLQGVTVSALALRSRGGVLRAVPASSSDGGRAQTDDRGRYRLFGLQPGAYVVRATTDAVVSATTGYVQTFYPGTPDIDSALPATLDADGMASGIDFTFQPGPTRRLRGTVVDATGTPATASLALTMSGRSGAIHAEPVRTSSNADGTFAFNNVAPGEYVVHAMMTGPAGPEARVNTARQYAAATVVITENEPPLLPLNLSAGATLMGRVVFEDLQRAPPPYTGVQLIAVPSDSDTRLLEPSGVAGFALLSDNTFEYRGVFGRNSLAGQLSLLDLNWYVKSITYRGRDLADSAFDFGSTGTFQDIEVVVSGAGAVLGGRVSDERGAPAGDYIIVVFPTDRSKWTFLSRWLKTRPPSADGGFRVTGLVPGDYWVVAVDRLDDDVAGDLQSPDVLDALASRAERVTLAERQSRDLALRLIRR